MDNNTIYNKEQQDVFSSRIRERLADYEMPVGKEMWENISAELSPKPSLFSFVWKMTALVAVMGVAGTFLYLNHPKMQSAVADSSMERAQTVVAPSETNITAQILEKNLSEEQPEMAIISAESKRISPETSQRSAEAAAEEEPKTLLEEEVEELRTVITHPDSIAAKQMLAHIDSAIFVKREQPQDLEQPAGDSLQKEKEIPSLVEPKNNLSSETLLPAEVEKEIVPDQFFTPNGDGINDIWRIEGLDAHLDYVVEIYDQYGNLLLQSKGDFTGWDGNYKGNLQPSTDYWYVIMLNETGKKITGNVSLRK
jgi:gliding motility-associated-like protein